MALIDTTGDHPGTAGTGAIAEGALAGLRSLVDEGAPWPDPGGAEAARVGVELGTGVWEPPSPSGHGASG